MSESRTLDASRQTVPFVAIVIGILAYMTMIAGAILDNMPGLWK